MKTQTQTWPCYWWKPVLKHIDTSLVDLILRRVVVSVFWRKRHLARTGRQRWRLRPRPLQTQGGTSPSAPNALRVAGRASTRCKYGPSCGRVRAG